MTTHVLILCTHNSGRSVLSEGVLNHLAQKLGKDVRAHSAGSAPSGHVHPLTIAALGNAGIDSSRYSSKSWHEFTRADAPPIRIVITVCGKVAKEVCPIWPGSPVQVYWSVPDSSSAVGEEAKRQFFELTRQAIGYRMLQLLALPLETMNNAELQAALNDIAKA